MATLRDWLQARGLERYAEALAANDIDLDILPELNDADLAAAGLPLGARKRLLQAIRDADGAKQTVPAAVAPPVADRRGAEGTSSSRLP